MIDVLGDMRAVRGEEGTPGPTPLLRRTPLKPGLGLKNPARKKPPKKTRKKPPEKTQPFMGFFGFFTFFFKGFYLFLGFIPFFRILLSFSGFLHYFFTPNHCKLLILS